MRSSIRSSDGGLSSRRRPDAWWSSKSTIARSNISASRIRAVGRGAGSVGEPANDIDSIFLATNLLLSVSFFGLSAFGYFFDIFASVGFVSLCFGLCRLYAGIQRGRAVGNNDFLAGLDPEVDGWLVMARLRFVPHAGLDVASGDTTSHILHL